MAIDLTAQETIQANLFVRLQVDEYRTTSSGSYSAQVLRFSDSNFNVDINSETYTPLGRLMNVTATASELRVSEYEVTVTLAGVPNSSINEILYSKIKGSPIEIYRGLFNPSTQALLSGLGDNPMLRFKGIVNNFSLNEEYDVDSRTSSNTLILTCTSDVSILSNKIGGRRTNPDSQKTFYPTDVSFDRVPNIKNTTYNFGKE